jgi:hypothetical protein
VPTKPILYLFQETAMTFVQRLLSTFVAVLLFGCFVNAQQPTSSTATIVPRLVNFSGKAVDAEGKIITGIAGVTFAIYSEQSQGSPLWLETQNVQADAKGNYTAQLGATKPEGLPLDLFTSGDARWLGVTVNGGEQQPRILLLSVPYALKAADAETIGGLPASAFVLAAPVVAAEASSSRPAPAANSLPAPSATSSDVTTSGGTVNSLPLFTTATNVQNSIVTQAGTSAVNVAGKLNHPATGAATATAGKNSQPETFVASAFNKTTSAPVAQTFQLQAEPTGNDTTAPSGTLNLLYGSGTAAPAETGLKISNKGLITFAAGQSFPTVTGNEAVTGNLTASELISTVATGTAPLKVASTTQVANLNASLLDGKPASAFATVGANSFVGNQSITGSMGIGTANPAQALDLGSNNNMIIRVDPGNDTTEANGGFELVGRGANGVPNTWWTMTAAVGGGFGVPANSYSIWQYPPNSTPGCCLPRLTILPAEASTDTGGAVTIDQNGNASQPTSAGGLVKAMVYVNAIIPPYEIVRCFNSALTGAAATTPPCGINFTEDASGPGYWDFAFPFEVADRFVSATTAYNICPGCGGGAASCVGAEGNSNVLPSNTIQVTTSDCGSNPRGAFFYLVVY